MASNYVKSIAREQLQTLTQKLENGETLDPEFDIQEIFRNIQQVYQDVLEATQKDFGRRLDDWGYLLKLCSEQNDHDYLLYTLKLLEEDFDVTSIVPPSHHRHAISIRENAVLNTYLNNIHSQYGLFMGNRTRQPSPFHGKGVVYTVRTNHYDALLDPLFPDDEWDYICFTDDPNTESDIWRIIQVPSSEGLDFVRLARKYKILCHQYLKDYDYSVYVDAKIRIVGNMRDYIENYSMGSPILCFPHYLSNCAYDEAVNCIMNQKDDPDLITSQIVAYADEGYPRYNGMIDSACLIRAHGDTTLQHAMETWWNEIRTRSRRDQLSFGYSCWKNELEYDMSDLYIYRNKYIHKEREGERDL